MIATITPQNSVVPYEGGVVILQIDSDAPGILETSSEQIAGVNHLPLANLSQHSFEAGLTTVTFTIYDRVNIGIDPDIILPQTPLGHSIFVECVDATVGRYVIMDQADIIQAGL